MLNENIKNLRKKKGLTQEELAIRLNVVRQTVSKWEKGISVPDAEMLQKIAAELEEDVSTLLGSPVEAQDNTNQIAEQLAKISEQLAIKNKRWHTVWKVLWITILVILILNILAAVVGAALFHSTKVDVVDTTETVELLEP